jgi:hypothetical protein
MTLTFADWLAVFMWSSVSAGIGAYVGAYLKRKGENVATHEDIARLVDQVKATTAATEAIRTEMSGKLWETQERWKAKRQLYTDLIHALRDTVAGWNGMWDAQTKFQRGIFTEQKREQWMQKWGEQVGNAREKIQDCFALANVVDPTLADMVDAMWTEVDEANSRSGADFLRRKAEVCDAVLKAVIKRGRAEFATT